MKKFKKRFFSFLFIALSFLFCFESFEFGASSEITYAYFGDLTYDGEIDTFDAYTILMYDCKLIALNGDALMRGDLDGDGECGTDDAVLILKRDVGLIKEFPVESAVILSAREFADAVTMGWDMAYWQENTGHFGAILALLKEKGINTVKLPITWLGNIGADGRLNEKLEKQVLSLVDEALYKDFFVVLGCYGNASEALAINVSNRKRLVAELTKIYKELCRVFGRYDSRVAFEFLNEPQDITSEHKWNADRERLEVYGEAVRAFVTEVRSHGGFNGKRNLLISSYGDISLGKGNEMWLPENDGHIAIAVHSYAPYSFAHDKNEINDWDLNSEIFKNEVFDPLKNAYDSFVKKGYPVFITEFASRDKDNTESRIKHAKYYGSVASGYGIKCFWWDTGKLNNGSFTNTFALINRAEEKWMFPDIADAFINAMNGVDADVVFDINIPSIMTEGETYNLDDLVKQISGKKAHVLYRVEGDAAVVDGKTLRVLSPGFFSLIVDNVEKIEKKIYVKNKEEKNDFSLSYRIVDGKRQLFPGSGSPSALRLDHDWFSSDPSVVSVSIYSTLTPLFDGTAEIYAFHKETGKYGKIKLTVKNGEIVLE